MAEDLDRDRERELVRLAKSGDKEAFGALFTAYREKVYAVARKYVKNREAALDIVQEAFLRAFRSIGSFKGDSLFYTWVVRIAINLAIDAGRRKHADGNIPFDKYVEGGDIRPVKERPAQSPGEAAELSEMEEALARAIEELSENHRGVFLLHAAEGLAYKDIAEALGISIGTVMSRLHYARKKLREMLAGHLGRSRFVGM
ncbi:MAG: sigma-70 family RNA polymerase sigma factor [Planctomycetota bacterium]|nr:MAG: sigma-70 family RNA polymerase sigma factor [Planctomycetota bacterium]